MGRPAKDSIGEIFGRLTVEKVGHAFVGKSFVGKSFVSVVEAKCACGGVWVGEINSLRSGTTKSCGCWNLDAITARNTKHGMSGTPEHRAWKGMKKRCLNAQGKDFHLYQGKGIRVCDRWLDSFGNFYADMGEKPSPKHSIERRDSDKNYEPSNCYWGTPMQQARNTSRNVFYKYEGSTKTLKEWCDELRLPYYTIKSRLADGWDVVKAFESPVKKTQAGRLFAFDGLELTAAQWSSRTGIGYTTLLHRLKSGWSIERALSTPVDLAKSR